MGSEQQWEIVEKLLAGYIARRELIEPCTDLYREVLFMAWLEPERYAIMLGFGLGEVLAVPVEEFGEEEVVG